MKPIIIFLLMCIVSLNAKAETNVHACGQLRYEVSFDRERLKAGENVFSITVLNTFGESYYRFELQPEFLKPGQLRYLNSYLNKLKPNSDDGVQICVRGRFSGSFRLFGTTDADVTLSRAAILPIDEINNSFEYF